MQQQPLTGKPVSHVQVLTVYRAPAFQLILLLVFLSKRVAEQVLHCLLVAVGALCSGVP